jgi:Na+/proline symporter
MSRILLNYILPLALPTAIYVVYVLMARDDAKALEGRLRAAPWFWLVIAGFMLMVAGLITLGIIDGNDPGTTYQPPHFEDGRVVPGEFK